MIEELQNTTILEEIKKGLKLEIMRNPGYSDRQKYVELFLIDSMYDYMEKCVDKQSKKIAEETGEDIDFIRERETMEILREMNVLVEEAPTTVH